jgi:hypothetical protein
MHSHPPHPPTVFPKHFLKVSSEKSLLYNKLVTIWAYETERRSAPEVYEKHIKPPLVEPTKSDIDHTDSKF